MPAHPLLAQAVSLSAAGRNADAILIVSQLAARGEPEALAMLGEMKWRGGMVPQDPAGARDLFRRAGAAGDAAGAARYTNLLASGVAGPRDWPEAVRRLRDEARRDPRRKQMAAVLDRMRLSPEGDPAIPPQATPLSAAPWVVSFPHLFSATECDYLRQLADPAYQPATVNTADGRVIRDPIRLSDASTIHWLIEDPVVHALNRRLAAASGTAADQGEAMQILRYRPGQQYRPHLDLARASDNQRVLTALVYLNHDYDGGETRFVKVDLKVKGRKGDAIVFRNDDGARNPDPLSEHAGLAVTRGVKFLASRWIREARWAP